LGVSTEYNAPTSTNELEFQAAWALENVKLPSNMATPQPTPNHEPTATKDSQVDSQPAGIMFVTVEPDAEKSTTVTTEESEPEFGIQTDPYVPDEPWTSSTGPTAYPSTTATVTIGTKLIGIMEDGKSRLIIPAPSTAVENGETTPFPTAVRETQTAVEAENPQPTEDVDSDEDLEEEEPEEESEEEPEEEDW
jgi:hypothetical protein